MKNETISCRKGCGACCIAPSISSALPLLPNGKKANITCPHLAQDFSCTIFTSPLRPLVCASLKAELEMCGANREEALSYLRALEDATKP